MPWMDEASVFIDYMSKMGSSTYACVEIFKILESNCRKEEDFVLIINNSKVLSFLVNSYIDENQDLLLHEFGDKWLTMLIVRSVGLPKKNGVGLTLMMKVVQCLDRNDILYNKCRRLFLKMGIELSKSEDSKYFNQFFMEIMDELHTGLCGFLENQGIWPSTVSLAMYISFLEKRANIDNNERVQECCILLLTDMKELLSGKLVKANSSMYFDLLLALDRLTKLFVGGEDQLRKLVVDRKDEIMALAVLVLESEEFTKVRQWLQEQNLVTTFFQFLIQKLRHLFGLVRADTISEATIYTFGHTLRIAKIVSNEVDGGKKDLDDLLNDRKEQENLVSKMLLLVEDNYCPDETLEVFENLLKMADPELKRRFALSVIPKIREGMPFEIEVDRTKLFKASKEIVLNATESELTGKLFVKFKGEEGIGLGVTREWLFLACQNLFDPQYKYFKADRADRRKVFPTLEKIDDPSVYIFFGRLIALALVHGVQVGATLEPIIVRMLAEFDIFLEDIKNFDPRLYENLNQQVQADLNSVLPNRVDQLPPHEKDNEEIVGKLRAELGREYSRNLVDEYFTHLISEKVAGLKVGMDCIFGERRRTLFFRTMETTTQLDMVLCGNPEELCVDEWEKHTYYEKYEKNDPHILSFWEIVRELSEKQKRDLLFFWTSVQFLPPGGFANLGSHLIISKTTHVNSYPHASTCANTLHIPPAPYKQLKYRLHIALTQETGFGYK